MYWQTPWSPIAEYDNYIEQAKAIPGFAELKELMEKPTAATLLGQKTIRKCYVYPLMHVHMAMAPDIPEEQSVVAGATIMKAWSVITKNEVLM